ncbi:MAG TPA: MerR family transcriptional regulator [bacterium]|nr:MerR family transcriptional regulator [bacterium]HPM98322.1 MerR family transcriptional regulator [bacterium]
MGTLLNKKTLAERVSGEFDNFSILRNIDFWLAYADHFTSDVGKRFSQMLNEKDNRLNIDDVTSRVLNNWEKNGLLEAERPEGKGWRKFSIMDLIWLRLVVELRKFGLPIEKIQKARKKLTGGKGFDGSEYPLLEFYVARAFTSRVPCFLLVFEDGRAEPLSDVQLNLGTQLRLFGNCIRISLNYILQEIYADLDLKPQFEHNLYLNPSEFELMSMIRMQNFESIKIKLNDGQIEMLEASRSEKVERRIIDILKEDKYQNIEIKQNNGNIVYINKTVKKKFEAT